VPVNKYKLVNKHASMLKTSLVKAASVTAVDEKNEQIYKEKKVRRK
jgi:hypothetical protein